MRSFLFCVSLSYTVALFYLFYFMFYVWCRAKSIESNLQPRSYSPDQSKAAPSPPFFAFSPSDPHRSSKHKPTSSLRLPFKPTCSHTTTCTLWGQIFRRRVRRKGVCESNCAGMGEKTREDEIDEWCGIT